MADQHSQYWKGDQAEALQARYRQLIEARDGGAPAEAVKNAQTMGLTPGDAEIAVSVSYQPMSTSDGTTPSSQPGARSSSGHCSRGGSKT